MKNNTSIIIGREYSERVKKKSFIFSTLAVPLLMLLLSALPALVMNFAGSSTKTLAVVDDSGLILPRLADTDEVRFIPIEESADDALASDSIYGVLIIDRNIVNRPSGLRIITSDSPSMSVETTVNSQVKKIIEDHKLAAYDIENLDQILADIDTDVSVQTIRAESVDDEGENQSAMVSSLLGTFLNLILYMFLLLYGSLVMNSIIEEKNNRVLEIVVSSVKPTQLLLGKIIGVGLVALTQILLWGVILVGISSFLLPALLPSDMLAEAAAVNAGSAVDSTMDVDLAVALGMITNLGYVCRLFAYMILFLIGGYLLYAAIFATIGAAVDNVQDASQLQMIGLVPIVAGLIASMAVVEDPNSTFALICSLFPLTSPMVMMARIPFEIPIWEILVAMALLAASIVFMIWFAAKVYRVGIFMYGKKPKITDLIRWARYK